MNTLPPKSARWFQDHPRGFERNRYVYPVVSRRAQGVSLGVNLNPDKVCNFDCVYCQVDRTRPGSGRFVDLPVVLRELEELIHLTRSGRLFEHPRFASVPERLRSLRDMAFSGDGEPTTYSNFDQIIAQCAELKRRCGVPELKMVLITNATMFHRPHVERGLELLEANGGEIWAKLETGTEAYYARVARTSIPFRQVLQNITRAAKRWPLVIQSLFMKIAGEPLPESELAAYCDRLQEILDQGGQIRRVQVYTVARPPAESYVEPLPDEHLERIAQTIRRRCQVEVEWYGSGRESD